MPAWLNRQRTIAPSATVGLQRVPCQHPYYETRTVESDDLLTWHKECLDCGKDFDFNRRRK